MFLARKKSENDRSNVGETDINCVKAFSTSSGGRYSNPKKANFGIFVILLK